MLNLVGCIYFHAISPIPSQISQEGNSGILLLITRSFPGCIGDCRVRNIYVDSDTAVERKRVNVDKNGCKCMGLICLNGGICVAGSPPYCLCKDGFTGFNCGTPIRPETGEYYFSSFVVCYNYNHLLFSSVFLPVLYKHAVIYSSLFS